MIYRCILLFLCLAEGAFAAGIPFDPFFWLEEVEGQKSMEWVQQQNARTRQSLETYPLFPELLNDAKSIFLADDHLPHVTFRDGYFYNFWTDGDHPHGLIRRTTLEEYRKNDPKWETLLDLDQLSRDENENWIFEGAVQLDEGSSRRILELSRGGKDAAVFREYDYETKKFVSDGFNIPEAKSRVTPVDQDHVLVESDFGPDSLTTSGYARTLRLWTRGQPLSESRQIFEISKEDVTTAATVFRDGSQKHVLVSRVTDFHHSEAFQLLPDLSLRKLPKPLSALVLDIKGGQMFLHLSEAWSNAQRTLPANSIISIPVDAASLENAEILFTASSRQSIESVAVRQEHVFVNLLDNIKSRVLELTKGPDGSWNETTLPFPSTGVIDFSPRKPSSDLTVMEYTDFLTPPTQYWVHDEDGTFRLEKLKSAPVRFDSSKYEVLQNFARSRDGTWIPYFVIERRDLKPDSSHPTLLYGYGGFGHSMTPYYSGLLGKLWLERGGVYVLANIRGGGEFGPAWHKAALKANRQRAFDDFIAVAEDLIERKITSPRHLGIKGGSNGGLLVGTVMVQRPDLFNAAHVGVPLLDMARYSKLLAGASWIGEYGDPDKPSECENLLAYSPYQNVKPGIEYPEPFFTTSTKDDRVHPSHARKMAARMAEQGHPFYFYEATDGGHTGTSRPDEEAYLDALEYTYLWSKLR